MKVTYRAYEDEKDLHWVKARIPITVMEDTKMIIALDEKGERVAAAVFDTWTSNSVCVHQVIDSPMVLRHRFFETIAEYVYVTCGRGIIYGLVPSSNKKAQKLDANIGFTEVARLKDALMDGEDMIIMELRKENCKFLPESLREAS